MKGIIISYNTNNKREIIDLNNYLFGRVVKVKRNNIIHYYYYKGLLHDISYYKLSNGCYYINSNDLLINVDNLNIIPVEKIAISEDNLNTAQEYFRSKFKEERVNNLGK